MRGRISLGHRFVWGSQKASLALLCVLAVMAIGAAKPTQPQAQKPQAQPSRRSTLASRLKVIQLVEPATSSAVSIEQALLGLRNVPPPGNQRVELPKIGQLAWAAQGVMTPPAVPGAGPIAVPADAYPIKLYFVLPDGIYVYNPVDHALQQTSETDVRDGMASALLNQAGIAAGGCQIVLAGSLQDFNRRYGTRSRTVMLLQAGRMAQSLQLEAVAQGLASLGIDNVDTAAVRRLTRLPRTLEPLYVVLVGYPAGQAPPSAAPAQVAQATALLVVPPQGFQDEELLGTKRGLEGAGVQVLIASTRMGLLLGMLGGTTQPDLLLNQAKLDNFQAIVFIGGAGTIDYLHNPTALTLARQAAVQRKVLAAIGTAPSILASAGTLKGVRATAYLSEQARLVQGGAVYTGNPVEKDGLIVTATGPQPLALFVRAVLDGLAEVTQTAVP